MICNIVSRGKMSVCFNLDQPTENHECLARCEGHLAFFLAAVPYTCKQASSSSRQQCDASAAQLFPAEPLLMDNSLLRPTTTFLLFLLRYTRTTCRYIFSTALAVLFTLVDSGI